MSKKQVLSGLLPLQIALALLVQHPELALTVTTPLPANPSAKGQDFLMQLIETLQASPQLTTAGLRERWRDRPEENWISELAAWHHAIPEGGMVQEFLGCLRQIQVMTIECEINSLLAKGTQQALSGEEKSCLSSWIAKKKALLNPV